MNPILGWSLAAIALFMAWQNYGAQGVGVVVSAIVFWLLLQFNRAIRVMKNAANEPVGSVASAVMLNAKLKRGMTMMQVVTMTHSLGKKVSDKPETWSWSDADPSTVTLVFDGRGKLKSWTLQRPEQP